MSTPVRTRFAPSPTGYLHVGGARTALFSWLFAKKHGGQFVLRVEDTDEARNTDEARAAIFEGMQWLGLDWEGPAYNGNQEGDCGPYNQSERTAIYDEWFQKLLTAGRVYEKDGASYFRFDRKPITFTDLVCGEITIDYSLEYDDSKSPDENRDAGYLPDLVIRRADGSYVFHFVNVVDDLTMGMTHVIRGEDHLMNTPKHLQLIEAFASAGCSAAIAPQYAHLPLILNPDGKKMSKRDQGAAVSEYQNDGFLPAAANNFFALLGWSPKDDSEIFSMEELTEKFTLENINRAPAKFDHEKCLWLNQQHLLALSEEDFVTASQPFAPEASSAILLSIREKISTLSEVSDAVSFLLNDDYPFDEEALTKVKGNDLAAPLLEKLAENFAALTDWSTAKETVGQTAKDNGAKPGQLMFPLRIALSGKAGGPDLGDILNILGQEKAVTRIQRCLKALS